MFDHMYKFIVFHSHALELVVLFSLHTSDSVCVCVCVCVCACVCVF